MEVALGRDQAHWLNTVMRAKAGEEVAVFNGRDGEWRAEIAALTKSGGSLHPAEQLRPQRPEPDLWLLFAPLKKDATDFVVEKATELGVSALGPVFTRHTVAQRVNSERLAANAREAAEQCERLSIPRLLPPESLEKLLADWDPTRRLLYMDETGGGAPIAEVASGLDGQSLAVLVGPEGGFAKSELDALRDLPFATAVGLGPRILRADTAALAALACLQAWCGDWRDRPAFR